jgi:hypothetical protein
MYNMEPTKYAQRKHESTSNVTKYSLAKLNPF